MKEGEPSKTEFQSVRNASGTKRLWRTTRKTASWLFLCWVLSLAWEFFQVVYNGDSYLRRRYGTELPYVTSVEIVSIGAWASPTLEPHFRELERIRPSGGGEHFIFRKKTVRGEDAKRIASLWRAQTPMDGSAGCHEPAYWLRFYTGPIKRAEVGICWHCYNFSVPALWTRTLLDFDAGSTNALALLDLLQRHAPLATDADFNYTNAPISMEEVERRIAEAMKPRRQHDLWAELAEFAVHSPQRDQFETSLGSKLGSEKLYEVRSALGVLDAMESSRHGEALSRLLAHDDEEVRLWAGRVLLEQGGTPAVTEALQSVGHTDQRTRFHAFASLARHAPMEPPIWLALSNRVEAVLAEFGTNAFSGIYTGDRVRLSSERCAQIVPLVERIAEECGTNFVRNFPTPKASSGR